MAGLLERQRVEMDELMEKAAAERLLFAEESVKKELALAEARRSRKRQYFEEREAAKKAKGQ